MIRHIAVNLPLRANKDRITAFAASLAGYFGAHVTGIAFMVLAPLCLRSNGRGRSAIHKKKHDTAAKEAADAAVDRLAIGIVAKVCPGTPTKYQFLSMKRPLRRNRPRV